MYGSESAMHLRNNLVNVELAVTPILYMADGTPLSLSPIIMPPSGSTEIPVNETLQNLGYTGNRVGGAEFHFEALHPGALAVETEVINSRDNFAFSVQSFSAADRGLNQQHAVFYLPTKDTGLYVGMYNSSDVQLTVRPTILSGNRTTELRPLVVPPHGFAKIELERKDFRQGLSSEGSVTLTHDGPAGALFTTGWLDDEEIGFSTMMTFEELGQSHSRTELFGAQIFTNSISSDIVLKNMSASPVTAAAEFYYVQSGTVGTAAVNIGLLRPGAVHGLHIENLQKRGLLPSTVDELSLHITYSGEPGALMGRIFGISNSGTYGYYSQLEDTTSARRAEILWTAKGGAKTRATIANFGRADRFTLELYNESGESSLTEIELEANESRTLDLAALGTAAFGAESSGGWSVSRQGEGRLVVKNHVIRPGGYSLPFYGSYIWVTDVYFTGPGTYTLDSNNTSTTVRSWKYWSDASSTLSPGGEGSEEDSDVVTMSDNSDIYGYWTITGQGPGLSYWVRMTKWIDWDETEHQWQGEYMMAQTFMNVKCAMTFQVTKDSSPASGHYTATVGVGSNICGNKTAGVSITPLLSGYKSSRFSWLEGAGISTLEMVR